MAISVYDHIQIRTAIHRRFTGMKTFKSRDIAIAGTGVSYSQMTQM